MSDYRGGYDYSDYDYCERPRRRHHRRHHNYDHCWNYDYSHCR